MGNQYFEDLIVGAEASLVRTVSESDIIAFAALSGDGNPVHLDEAYAARTPFKQRIAHGILSASCFSTVFATKLPGPGAISVSQTLNFRAPVYPVYIGDEPRAMVRLTELIAAKKRAMFAYICHVGDRVVLEGQAVIMIPSRQKG